MSQPVIRDNFSRGEAIAGITWLSVGALGSLILEVAYLNWFWVIIAAVFNAVLAKTARLWSSKSMIVPLAVWAAALFASMIILPPTGWTLTLLIAGLAGGVWPLIKTK